MNLMKFFTPKSEVAVLYDTYTLRQVLEKMEVHHFVALPMLSADNRYVGTVSAGDILGYCKMHGFSTIRDAEKVSIRAVPQHLYASAVTVDTAPERLYEALLQDNFVPVEDDRGYFIGIVTRRRYMETCFPHKEQPQSTVVPYTYGRKTGCCTEGTATI